MVVPALAFSKCIASSIILTGMCIFGKQFITGSCSTCFQSGLQHRSTYAYDIISLGQYLKHNCCLLLKPNAIICGYICSLWMLARVLEGLLRYRGGLEMLPHQKKLFPHALGLFGIPVLERLPHFQASPNLKNNHARHLSIITLRQFDSFFLGLMDNKGCSCIILPKAKNIHPCVELSDVPLCSA